MSTRLDNIRKWVKQGFAQSPANCRFVLDELQRSQTEANALREAYAELRERYNNEKVKTGRYDHAIF